MDDSPIPYTGDWKLGSFFGRIKPDCNSKKMKKRNLQLVTAASSGLTLARPLPESPAGDGFY
jgi:hypothetical protein